MKEPCIVIYMQFYHVLDLETIVLPWRRAFSASETRKHFNFNTRRKKKSVF